MSSTKFHVECNLGSVVFWGGKEHELKRSVYVVHLCLVSKFKNIPIYFLKNIVFIYF